VRPQDPEHFDVRQVKHLTLFLGLDGLIRQISAAFRAGVEREVHGGVGAFACLKGLTGMAAGFASRILRAQRIGALQAIAGGWLAAAGAVFVESAFQLGDSGFEPGAVRFELVDDHADKLHHRIHPALIKGGLDDRSQDFGALFQHANSVEYAGIYLSFLNDKGTGL